MSIRSWVLKQLTESGRVAIPAAAGAIKVSRDGWPDVVVFAAEPSVEPFGPSDLDEVLTRVPECEVLVITRRAVEHGVFEQAASLGVLLETFGGLDRALGVRNVTTYQHPDEQYLRSRLERHPSVRGVERIGLKAWRVTRRGSLRPLEIVTHDRYEFTDDELWTLVANYPGLNPDAFVVTNPYANGFGNRVVTSAQGLGAILCTLDEFVARLGRAWT